MEVPAHLKVEKILSAIVSLASKDQLAKGLFLVQDFHAVMEALVFATESLKPHSVGMQDLLSKMLLPVDADLDSTVLTAHLEWIAELLVAGSDPCANLQSEVITLSINASETAGARDVCMDISVY